MATAVMANFGEPSGSGIDVTDRVYLPSQEEGIDIREYLFRYVEREFPEAEDGRNAVYGVPPIFQKNSGEKQANLAEQVVFRRLQGIADAENLPGIWMIFFHSATYAGRSYRNHRVGKLIFREHDFVIFARYRGKSIVALAEIKSTHDANTRIEHLEITSDAKVIKNNKRSAQHQLRDHMEVLQHHFGLHPEDQQIQSYIMWPFLGAYTKDPKNNVRRRWEDDDDLHVFENVLQNQNVFDRWFEEKVIGGCGCEEGTFVELLKRYIVLSCGTFVNEIHEGMMALLTQEQLQLINSDLCKKPNNGPLVVHGAAGTGKTLLVLRKLEQLYHSGRLNDDNRALYICYWPGIRYDFQRRLKILGIDRFVDTARYFISMTGFLAFNKRKYRHVFVDEAEAICLSFQQEISTSTLSAIYLRYHAGNCSDKNCYLNPSDHNTADDWGELWLLVDTNQASLFLPKYSPQVMKTPTLLLTKVMRSTGYIFDVFKQFYAVPMPSLPPALLNNITIPTITMGHHINGPPSYWANAEDSGCSDGRKCCVVCAVVHVVVDLCSTKGFKPNDVCVIPFLYNEHFTLDNVNAKIEELFVENGYRPKAVGDVEEFIGNKRVNDFLVAWALRVKGLEFKVVIAAFDEEDFDLRDAEDRKRAYIIMSRCTSMLVMVSPLATKVALDVGGKMKRYPFSLTFD